MHQAWRRKLLATLAVVAGLAGSAPAVEPVDQFLAALRQRQLFDEALDYLDLLKTSSRVDESLRQRVLYEQGVTVLASAASLRDPAARDAQLAKASGLFERFLKDAPEHALAGVAKIELANVLVERARTDSDAARSPSGDVSRMTVARERFEEARAQFDAADKEMQAQLAKLPKLVDPADQQTQARKQQLTGAIAQARILRPTIDYELAATFAAGSRESKEHLQAAAASYRAVYETYRTRAAGLLARLWEGRCYQQIGELRQALGCYRELMDLPPSEETRLLRIKSTRHALECLTDDKEKNYEEAIERGQRWEKEAGANETDADALAIRYLTALAYQAQSSALPAKDPNRKKLAGFAREYVGPVAVHPGEYQRPARVLLVALAGGKEPKEGAAAKPTFAEALEQAKQALEKMQEAEAGLKAGNADKSATAALKRQKESSANLARHALNLALTLSDEKVSAEDLNSARYYLCYIEWDAGNLYDAAVLGEFLARRYPDTSPGRQGARIALAAYLRMFADSSQPDKKFEARRIEALGQEIFKRWPGEEESDEAALQLLSFAANQGQWVEVLEYLKKVSANSPRRGQAELRAGQALWSAYLRRWQLPQGERPPQAELDGLKKQAQDVLEQGIARMEQSGSVDPTVAAAAFALAQICVETGQPDKAITWLEHPKVGPLALVKANSPAAARQGFPVETYKLALRAYIAVHPQQLKKAEESMDALEKLVKGAGDAKAAENLTAIYISLGRELEQHLQDLRKSGQTKELGDVSKAFEVFLDRVTKRETGNSYASLNWVGETYFSLGSGLDEGTAKASPKVKAYFQKATDAYKRMLEIAEKDPKFKDNPDSLIGVRLRLADCYRRAGNFDEAIKIIMAALKQKPMLLTAQVQAAETFQAQGGVDPKGYASAILGGAPARDGKNVVWGWAKLSKMTMGNPKFQDTFHHARLNLADARYRYGLAQQDAAKRAGVLEAAKQDLWHTYKLQPDLGGAETSARYDRLLKQIQQALGAKEAGLAEFRERETTSASTAKAK